MSELKKKKENKNYLDYIPVHNEKFLWSTDESGGVIICVENKGICNRIAQKMFQKPRVSHIHLDEIGNFVWPLIDGKHSVYEIAGLVKEHFGEKAEPLYIRLIGFLQNLERHGFIKQLDTPK